MVYYRPEFLIWEGHHFGGILQKIDGFATSPFGSYFLSFLIHSFIVLSVFAYIHWELSSSPPSQETYTDEGYDWVDAPPDPTQEATRIRSAPTKIVEKIQEKVDDAPRELQDEKGEVAGTQKKKAAASTLGAEGEGTAATTPFYKVKPKYPRKALASGLEGWVMMKVDITKEGTVENVRVVGGEHRGEFQNEAQRAIGQWKYRPFLGEKGEPIEKIDHLVRVDFNIEDY